MCLTIIEGEDVFMWFLTIQIFLFCELFPHLLYRVIFIFFTRKSLTSSTLAVRLVGYMGILGFLGKSGDGALLCVRHKLISWFFFYIYTLTRGHVY